MFELVLLIFISILYVIEILCHEKDKKKLEELENKDMELIE